MTSFYGSNSFTNPYPIPHPANIGYKQLDIVNSSLQFVRPEKDESQSSLANYIRKLSKWHGRKAPSPSQPTSAGSSSQRQQHQRQQQQQQQQQQSHHRHRSISFSAWQDHELESAASPQTIPVPKYGHRERSHTVNEEEQRYSHAYTDLGSPHIRSPRCTRAASVNIPTLPTPSLSPSSSSSSSVSSDIPSSFQFPNASAPSSDPISFRRKSNSIAVHGQAQNRKHSWAPSVVTASSYDALGISPALSFLAQFAAPKSPCPAYTEGDQVGGYILGKVVGRGGFSTVREAHVVDPVSNELGRKVACKIVENGGRDRVEKEVAIWKNLRHECILDFLDIEESEGMLFIFSEFCEGGDLLHQLTSGGGGKLTEEQAREKFLQIADAVRYLHEDARVCHKDLKLENVLIDAKGGLKLADFGLAEWMDLETEQMNLPPRSPISDESSGPQPLDVQEEIAGGSLAYASPEQLKTSKVIRCPATDIWSLGVILYAFVTGTLPFMDDYEPRMQFKILNCRYDEPSNVSEACKELIKGCFATKPAERLDIQAVLQSDWCTM